MNFLNPEEVLKKIKLKQDIKVADFGCGSGGWVIPLSKKVELGKIFAFDLSEEVLSVLSSRLKFDSIENVKFEKVNVENGVPLNDNSMDLVLMTNLLSQVKDIKKTLKEGKRVLSKNGKILVVDWEKDNSINKVKVGDKDVRKIAEDMGFKIEKKIDAGVFHYGFILVN